MRMAPILNSIAGPAGLRRHARTCPNVLERGPIGLQVAGRRLLGALLGRSRGRSGVLEHLVATLPAPQQSATGNDSSSSTSDSSSSSSRHHKKHKKGKKDKKDKKSKHKKDKKDKKDKKNKRGHNDKEDAKQASQEARA